MLLCVFLLPLAGAALYGLLSRLVSIRQHTHLAFLCAMLLAFIAAWIVRPASLELVVGNWSPISFTGTPLVLITYPAAMSILAVVLLVIIVSSAQRAQRLTPSSAVMMAMVFIALAITALAQNLVTLLIGIGLVDLYSVLHNVIHSRQPTRALRDGLYHGASLLLLLITFALYAAEGNSLYLPLAHLPARFGVYLMIALVMRFSLLPLRSINDQLSDDAWVSKASPLAGLLLMMRLPQLMEGEFRAWFFGLLLVTALVALIIGALSADRARLRSAVDTGAFVVAALSAVVWQNGIMAVAAIAWLLGTALLAQTATGYPRIARLAVRVARMIGAASLIGLPLTIGFIGRAGIISTWAGRGAGGAALIVAFALAQLLLVICVIRLALWPDAPAPEQKAEPAQWIGLATLIICGLGIVVFGLNPELAAAPDLGATFSRNKFVDWLMWLLPTLLGAAAWWFEARWLKWTTNIRDTLIKIISLAWWQDILGGAVGRIARPLGGVFTFLESEGVLLWAIIVVLIVVLVSRPGGP